MQEHLIKFYKHTGSEKILKLLIFGYTNKTPNKHIYLDSIKNNSYVYMYLLIKKHWINLATLVLFFLNFVICIWKNSRCFCRKRQIKFVHLWNDTTTQPSIILL